MKFENGYIYHIYNQGNNRQNIFFNRDNYLFFLKKIKTHITPYSDILAWCLMPNHFHLMVLVNEISLPIDLTEGFVQSGFEVKTEGFAKSETLGSRSRTLNQSIGIMLRSYTSAINKQENRSGSLFRKVTKSECINCPKGLTPLFYNMEYNTQIRVDHSELQYPQICFQYIHQNPVKAGLVNTETAWEFSSAQDYAGLRNGSLVNKVVAKSTLCFEDLITEGFALSEALSRLDDKSSVAEIA
ncbi:MAG: transposase [Bacteroidales bacterium]